VETERNPNEPGKSGGPGQQGGQEGIARDRNVNASSASARSRAVAANKVAVSKADDKADCRCINGRQKLPSAAWDSARSQCRLYNLEAIGLLPLERVTSP
jgi:hypothetical protein